MDHLAVLRLLVEDFNHDNIAITSETTFEELRMDSYDVVEFLIKVEEHFGFVIDNDTVSIAGIAYKNRI